MHRYRRPTRLIPVSLYVAMVLLLLAEAALPVSVGWHQVMESAVIAAMLGLMAVWRRRHAGMLGDAALLHTFEQQRGFQRQTPLTEVQSRYLLAHIRGARYHDDDDV